MTIIAKASKAFLRAHAKKLRQEREQGGTAVTLENGTEVFVDTDRDSISALVGVTVQVQSNLRNYPIRWKGGGEFFSIATHADLMALSGAAGAYVQKAYDAEEAALIAIEDGSADTRPKVEAVFDQFFT